MAKDLKIAEAQKELKDLAAKLESTETANQVQKTLLDSIGVLIDKQLKSGQGPGERNDFFQAVVELICVPTEVKDEKKRKK